MLKYAAKKKLKYIVFNVNVQFANILNTGEGGNGLLINSV